MAATFVDSLKNLLGTVNTGRIVFYGAAGLPGTVVGMMIFGLLETPKLKPLREQASADALKAFTRWEALLPLALILGFLIAVASFELIINQLDDKSTHDEHAPPSSFAYNYPWLRNEQEPNYAEFLISEYYRWVEIAVHVPVGGMLGLFGLIAYELVYLWIKGSLDANNDNQITVLATSAVFVITLVLWWLIWLPLVVQPTSRTYGIAKWRLIQGVKKKAKEGRGTEQCEEVT